MARLTTIDIEKLRTGVQKLTELDMGIFDCVKKISEAMSSLDKGWQSEVKASFLESWQTDAEAMCEMLEQYEEIHELLLQAALDFQNTEQETLAQIRSLR